LTAGWLSADSRPARDEAALAWHIRPRAAGASALTRKRESPRPLCDNLRQGSGRAFPAARRYLAPLIPAKPALESRLRGNKRNILHCPHRCETGFLRAGEAGTGGSKQCVELVPVTGLCPQHTGSGGIVQDGGETWMAGTGLRPGRP